MNLVKTTNLFASLAICATLFAGTAAFSQQGAAELWIWDDLDTTLSLDNSIRELAGSIVSLDFSVVGTNTSTLISLDHSLKATIAPCKRMANRRTSPVI